MINKRLWIALLAIPICLISVLLVGAQRSRQADAGGVIDPTCTSPSPCIEYDNNGSGPGIRGVSIGGNGLAGATKFNSTSPANSREGLIGNDVSTSGIYNAGVRGLSVRGTGVSGQSTNGPGIFASSQNGEGLNGLSTNNHGVDGATANNSIASGAGFAGVVGRDNSTDGGSLNVGVVGLSTNGFGLSAISSNFIGANVTGNVDPPGNNLYPALSVVGNVGALSDLIDACAPGTSPCHSQRTSLSPAVFKVDAEGDVDIAGVISTSGSCSSGCAATAVSGEKKVRLYTPQESLPTVEDFGDAELVNGQAYIRIDPAFANTIDPRANYMVFITPEGPSRGLYVTQKSLAGFAVRENPGGNSTLAFSYRIVAKPFGEHQVRLQMFTMAKPVALPAPKLNGPRSRP